MSDTPTGTSSEPISDVSTDAATTATNIRSQYRYYMLGIVSYVAPAGIQMILFPWLVAVQLNESADRLGIAQMMTQLPGLFLILIGGLLADKIDPRKILITSHLVAIFPALAIAALIFTNNLSYTVLIFYALAMGVVNAFVNPARDGMLNSVAGGQLQRTVTVAMGLTFGAQLIGYTAAGFADVTGAIPLLIFQACILLYGAYLATRLSPAILFRPREEGSGLSQIKRGLNVVWSSSDMRPVMLILTFMSFFFGGCFMVINPLMVRDVYGGSASEISLLYSMFVIGTVTSTAIMVSIGGLQKPGLALLISVFAGGGVLGLSALAPPFWAYLLIIGGWGMCGGVAMSMGRTIMQTSAPDNFRARVMSVFALANTGGMPLGALTLGYSAKFFGLVPTIIFVTLGIWTVAFFVWRFSSITTIKSV